jgi:hypothetical protein
MQVVSAGAGTVAVMSSAWAENAHPAVAAVAAIDAATSEVLSANLWSLPAGELARLLVATEIAARRLDAARVALTAQAERSLVAEHEGATSLPAFLRAAADVPVGVTKARLALSRALTARPVAFAAFEAGDIGADAAAAVCAAVDGLPGGVPAALTSSIESLLVDVARHDGSAAVAREAANIVYRFAPDVLERDEAAASEAERFTVRLRPDGGLTHYGSLGAESAAVVLAALDAYGAPRPSDDGRPDMRDAATRYAEAFVSICRVASGSAQSPTVHGEPPHVVVTVGLDALEHRLGAEPGRLAHGAPLSAAAVRRLACDAKVIPVVLGASSEPLDIGRATRVVPASMRRALEVRDGGCVMRGCTRPAGWCDAHHARHWANGGPTTLPNLLLLCAKHHTVVHRDGWGVVFLDGVPALVPPGWIDPARTPRVHARFRRRELGGGRDP